MFEVSLPGTLGSTLISSGFQYPDERSVSLTPVSSRSTSRILETHHGRTLLMLGHAAEHLATSRRFATGERSDDEAVHILRSASREVFEEYAEGLLESGNGGGAAMGMSTLFGSN